MKKKKPDTRKPCAMVRISPETHRRMKIYIARLGLVQSSFVDRAILAAIPGDPRRPPRKTAKRQASTVAE